MDQVTKTSFSALSALRTPLALTAAAVCGLIGLAGCGGSSDSNSAGSGLPTAKATQGQVAHGRAIFTTFGCVDCHSQGKNDPNSSTWMAGYVKGGNQGIFQIGPFATYAANLTPDAVTGLGNMTDQQIYNALKYGLDPGATPDATITGTTPGQGNFPAQPHFLAPPMPWTSTRHMSDDDLWALTAYIKHGIKAVSNVVPDSQGPPDFWASSYTPDKVGPYPLPAYPAANEQFTP